MATLTLLKSTDRGLADHGWQKSLHSFVFDARHDTANTCFRSLQLINENLMAPGGGSPMLSHQGLEILTYVLQGALELKDNQGNNRVLKAGQGQLTTAGQGVTLSSANPSPTDPTHLLEVWIGSQRVDLPPRHTPWPSVSELAAQRKVLVASMDGRDGSALIHQDAEIYRLEMTCGDTLSHHLHPGRGLWLQVVRGQLSLSGVSLAAGDAASTEDPGTLTITAKENTEALLFDLG